MQCLGTGIEITKVARPGGWGELSPGRKIFMLQLLPCKQDSRRHRLDGFSTEVSADVDECRSGLPPASR